MGQFSLANIEASKREKFSSFFGSSLPETDVMFKIIRKIFQSRILRIVLRFIGSLASAIILVSGYLHFQNSNMKNKENDKNRKSDSKDEWSNQPEDEQTSGNNFH